MRQVPSTVVVVAALSFASGAIARAQVQIQPGGSTGSVLFDPSGNLVVDGHCFGNVNPLPTGPAIKIFGGSAVAGGGNVFFSGPVNFGSSTFPGGIVIRAAGTAIASFGPDVMHPDRTALNAAGKCSNTSGYSNTKWDPAAWAFDLASDNNCYTYAVDMNFSDQVIRGPGTVQDGPLCTCNCICDMNIHTEGTSVGLIERAQHDGLVLAPGPSDWPKSPSISRRADHAARRQFVQLPGPRQPRVHDG